MDHRIVAVETGNMLGKGFFMGGLVPWFLWTRKHSLVYICGAGQTLRHDRSHSVYISSV